MALSIQAEVNFPAGAGQVLSVMSDVSSWQVADRPRLISAKNNKVTLAFEDFTRAVITLETAENGSTAKILHELIKDGSQLESRQIYWKEVVVEMRQRLDQK